MSSNTRILVRIRFQTQYSLILVFLAVLIISVFSVKCEGGELGEQTEGSGTENNEEEGEDDGDGGEDEWDEAGADDGGGAEEDGGEDYDEGSSEEENAAAAASGGEGDDDEKRRRGCGNKARWVKCGKPCPMICNRRTRACKAGCVRGCRCYPGFIFKNSRKRNCVRRRNCPRRRG